MDREFGQRQFPRLVERVRKLLHQELIDVRPIRRPPVFLFTPGVRRQAGDSPFFDGSALRPLQMFMISSGVFRVSLPAFEARSQ